MLLFLIFIALFPLLSSYVEPIIDARSDDARAGRLSEESPANIAPEPKQEAEPEAPSQAAPASQAPAKTAPEPGHEPQAAQPKTAPSLSLPSGSRMFVEDFSSIKKIKESRNMRSSPSSDWWVSSGGYLYGEDGIGSTVIGRISAVDPWRISYSISNPRDTDNGYFPQNIFRLILKSQWENLRQEAYFRIVNDNLSESPNRNESNGLLLFNRYQDEFNLYYTGIRVDGYAVIKKKIDDVYYTMAYEKVINGRDYDREDNPNLLPKDKWIGLRSEVLNNEDGTVSIKLYIDMDKSGNWVLAAETRDNGRRYGGESFLGEGYAGIRTDFMDVEFDDYKIVEI